MLIRNAFWGMTLALMTVSVVGAVEVKLPFDAESLAAQGQRKCPDYVKLSGRKDVLTVSISEGSKNTYDGQYNINAKKGAGHSVDITLGVKADNLSSGDRKVPKIIGKITVGNVSRHIAGDKTDWQNCKFKNVRVPGNGLVKLRITLRNVCGDVSIRDPRADVNIPKRELNKKKKNKKHRN